MKKPNVRTPQLDLDLSRKPSGRGGWRPNAGRPKAATQVPHVAREDFAARYPQHITLRLVDGLPSLRTEGTVTLIWRAIERSQRADFRIVEFNVEDNHLHLITESSGADSVRSGIKGFEVRIARRLNRSLGRTGRVFDDRYHMRILKTPREVKNAVRYVLLNKRHHMAERGQYLPADWIDPGSSAMWFDGWKQPIAIDAPWKQRMRDMARPTALARTWLLAKGWKLHGLIGFEEVPRGSQKPNGRRRTSPVLPSRAWRRRLGA